MVIRGKQSIHQEKIEGERGKRNGEAERWIQSESERGRKGERQRRR